MEENKYIDLLGEHGIKPTANRIVIIKALSQASNPMSLSELENKIISIDKSNIFRVLNIFKAHHLVHIIDSGSYGVRYELCLSQNYNTDDDEHTHFYCTNCGQTSCLDHTPIPVPELPDGYKITSISYLIKGICPTCSRKLSGNT